MRLSLYSTSLVIYCLPLALPAMAQLDSSALRAKYGPPLNRETYRMQAGFDLIVDYGAGNEVCRLQVPALMPTKDKVSSASEMKQRMYDFLADLVPASLRGKEQGRYDLGVGGVSFLVSGYERVTITEVYVKDPFNDQNTIAVSFKDENCQQLTRQYSWK